MTEDFDVDELGFDPAELGFAPARIRRPAPSRDERRLRLGRSDVAARRRLAPPVAAASCCWSR